MVRVEFCILFFYKQYTNYQKLILFEIPVVQTKSKFLKYSQGFSIGYSYKKTRQNFNSAKLTILTSSNFY